MKVRSVLHVSFYLFIFSALGFKLGGGFRTDHLFSYVLLILSLIGLIAGEKVNKASFFSSLYFASAFILTLISDFYITPNNREISVLQAGENLFNPFAIFFVFSVLVKVIDEKKFETTILVFACLVSIIGIYSFVSPNSGFFNLLASAVDDEESVRTQSQLLGRYLGIFNQPLESGLFHGSIQLFVCFLLLKGKVNKRFLVFTLLLNSVAGFLSLSKTFYILSLVVVLLMLFVFKKYKQLAFFLSFIVAAVLIGLILITSSTYIDSLFELYDNYGLIMAITAGRFGADESTGVTELFSQVWNNSPFLGFGFGTHLPLDNGFLEYYYQGGLLAVIPIIFFLKYQFRKSMVNSDLHEGKFLFCFLIFLILASFGGPVFTANKANIAIIGIITFSNIKLKK